MEGLCFGVAFFVSSGRGEKHKIDEAGAILLWVTLFFGKGGGIEKKKHMWRLPKQMIGDNWVEKIRELNHLVLQLETYKSIPLEDS